MKIYLSGPMSKYAKSGYNYKTFHAEASRLRELGYEVLNPAENLNGETHHPRHKYMRIDLENLLKADAVVVMGDWEDSDGVRLELRIAKELALPVYDTNIKFVRLPADL